MASDPVGVARGCHRALDVNSWYRVIDGRWGGPAFDGSLPEAFVAGRVAVLTGCTALSSAAALGVTTSLRVWRGRRPVPHTGRVHFAFFLGLIGVGLMRRGAGLGGVAGLVVAAVTAAQVGVAVPAWGAPLTRAVSAPDLTAVAVFSAPAAADPAQQVTVSVTSPACAGASMSLSERYGTIDGVTGTVSIGPVTADGTGVATFAATVPSDAAKTSEAMPLYWVGSSPTATCESTLSPVAAQTTVTAASDAVVGVNGTAAQPVLTLSGCAGGLADVHVVNKDMIPTAIPGLVLQSGNLTASLKVPKGSQALYVDCLQASVPGYTGRGLALPGGGPAPDLNKTGPGQTVTPGRVARWAGQTCTRSGTAYGWPMTCGTGAPFVAAMQTLSSTPYLRGLEERTIGSDSLLPALASSEDLVLAHPAKSSGAPGEAITGSEVAQRPATPDAGSGGHTYTSTSTIPGGTVVSTTYGTDADNFGVSSTVEGVLGPEQLKKGHLRSGKMTTTGSEKFSAQTCPDVNGLLKLTEEWTFTLTINAVDRYGRKESITAKGHATGLYTVHVNDSAEYMSFDVSAKDEISGSGHWDGADYNPGESHASYEHSGFPMHTPNDIQDTMVSKVLPGYTAQYVAPNLAAAQGAVKFLAVVLMGFPETYGAREAYAKFNTQAACLPVTFTGPQTVDPASTNDYTLQVRPTVGGALSVPVTLTTDAGSVDPNSVTATDTNAPEFQFTAPAKNGDDELQANGKSKRGVVSGSYAVKVNTLQLTLSYTATVSESDTCSGQSCPGPGDTGQSDFGIAATITGSASMPLSLTGDTEKGKGSSSETVQSYDDTENFTGPAVGCDQNATVQVTGAVNGTKPGPFGGLVTLSTASGSVTGVDLQYWIFNSDNTKAASEQITTTWDFTAPPECTGTQTYTDTENNAAGTIEGLAAEAGEYPGFGTPIFQLPDSAWTISPTWTPAKGGTLATATVTLSDATSTTTEQFTLSTPSI
jgi:hypothetical protein